MKKLYKVAGAILLLVFCCFFGFWAGRNSLQENTTQSEKTMKVDTESIALVNQDVGVKVNDETVNYATKLLSDIPDNFSVTGLEIARNGLKSGNYAAYIILPTSFSESVISLNNVPRKSEIQFAINDNLDDEVQEKVTLDTLAFINGLNHDLSYMYISTVLKEFHSAQDAALTVMDHDANDRDVILEIKPQDLLELVPVPELARLENNREYLDIQEYIARNQELVRTVDQQYSQYISLSREDYEKLSESGKGLIGEWEVMETTLENVDLVHNEQGENLFEPGMIETTELLKKHNLDLGVRADEIGDITKEGIKNISAIIEKLNQMLADYEQTFKSGISDEKVAQLKGLYPQILISNENGSLLMNGIQIPITYTDTEINQTCEEKWKTQYAAKVLILENYFKDMENYRSTLPPMPEPTPPETQPEPVAEGEGTEEGGGEVVPPNPLPEWNVSQELLLAAGYGTLQDAYCEISENAISGALQQLQIDKSVDAETLKNTMQTAANNILVPGKNGYDSAIDNFVRGLPIFETKVMDENGEEGSIQKSIEEELKKLEANTREDLLEPVKVEEVETTVTDKVVQPLLDKTELVKSNLLSQYDSEKTQLQSYDLLLNDFDPLKYIEQDEIQKTVGQMDENGASLQEEIQKFGDHGVEYADKVYATANENLDLLGQHIQEAQKTSEDAVKDGLQQAKSVKESNSAANQSLMLELTKKLPFTRLGSLEFEKAYEFMANPLELNQKFEEKPKQEAGDVEPGKPDKIIDVTPILIGILVLSICIAAIEFVRRYASRKNEEKTVRIN